MQANPLNHKQPDIHLMGGSRGMLAAKQPLVVPMLLRLSHFKLNSYVVLVVSRQKGITLVFKTDPLQNVDINSTFDSIAVIQKFIQREIEEQLRQMFREDLPGIIHRLSQQWVKAKVEAPYLSRNPVAQRQYAAETASTPDQASYRTPSSPRLAPSIVRRPTSIPNFNRARSSSALSMSNAGRARRPGSPASPAATPSGPEPAHDGPTSFPEIEHYDPTYGLRPEGLPNKSVFGGFRSLFGQSKGLADLAEEPGDTEVNDDVSYAGTWDDFLSDGYPGPSVSEVGDPTEYETVPAVGGGTITRPRVYHSQSQIQSPVSEVDMNQTPSMTSFRRHLSSRPNLLLAPSLLPRTPSLPNTSYNPYFAGATPLFDLPTGGHPAFRQGPWSAGPSSRVLSPAQSIPPVPALHYSPLRRGDSSSSLQTQPSRSSEDHSVPTPPLPEEHTASIPMARPRRLSTTSSALDSITGSPLDRYHMPEPDPKIVLRPSLNNSISKLSTLSHSNHTLSPYTRTFEHFAVRSGPPRDVSAGPSSSVDRPPVKARRKRIHRLGKKPAPPPEPDPAEPLWDEDPLSRPTSPAAARSPSEFDASEMDLYFRAHDEMMPRYPANMHPPHIRRRPIHQFAPS